MSFAQKIDFNALMEPVALRLLGEPAQKLGNEWRYGGRGSLAIDLKKGSWFDHEANVGGGVFDLIRRQGYDQPAAWLRGEGLIGSPQVVSRTDPKIVKTYDYLDEIGELLFQVVRFEPKDFKQRRLDGRGRWIWKLGDARRVPYFLPELVKAVAAGETIYIPEGEKDVDNLRAIGLAATTNPGGIKKWRAEYSEYLRGADIVVLPDNHAEGREHGEQVVASLHGIAKRIRILDFGKHWDGCPDKGDISDWLYAGGSAEKLKAIVDALPEASASADNQHSEPLHTWESPDWSILDDRRGDLPKFPADCLGKAFMTVRRAAKGAGVTDAHVAVPMLGIASSLIGVARRIQASTSWLEPCTMWCGIVGFSGTGKTPGLEVTKRALAAVEREKRDDLAELRRKHDSKVEAARAARAAWKKQVEAAVENGGIPPEMPKEAQDPGKFVAPKLYVSDGTIERMGELLTARPQGIIRILDELAGMFTNMQRYSGGQDNEFWLEAWNGNSYSTERMGRQLHVDHLLVGVVGGFQPDKLVKAFAGDDDGMYARFIFAWPEQAPHTKLADEIGSVDHNLKDALARLDALAKFTEEGALLESSIKLSDAARAEFEQLRQFAHDQTQLLEGRDREWMSKVPAHVLRLAGTLCLLDWAWDKTTTAEPIEVDALYMQRAIKLVREYFWPHARASLRLAGISERHATARRALHWIRASSLEEVSLLNIRREALAHTLDEVGTKVLLDGLERAGWLQQTPRTAGAGPGRPARRWRINPLLRKSNAGNAENAEIHPNGCGAPPPAPISAIPAISAPPSAADPDGASGDGLDIPDFLDRRPALRPAGDRLDDLR